MNSWQKARDDWNRAIQEGRVVRYGATAKSFPTVEAAQAFLKNLEIVGVKASIIRI